jgi:hypothetical protein
VFITHEARVGGAGNRARTGDFDVVRNVGGSLRIGS